MADAYELTTWLWLPRPRDTVFAFFADAHNLERITPPFLRFQVLHDGPIEMRPGAIIPYRLRLHGVPLRWRSEISSWNPPHDFTDTQLKGPYKEWVHTHAFDEHEGGTMVRDHVRYRLPGPTFASRLVNRFMVAPDTTGIFEFRHRALCEAFDARHTARAGPVTITRRDA